MNFWKILKLVSRLNLLGLIFLIRFKKLKNSIWYPKNIGLEKKKFCSFYFWNLPIFVTKKIQKLQKIPLKNSNQSFPSEILHSQQSKALRALYPEREWKKNFRKRIASTSRRTSTIERSVILETLYKRRHLKDNQDIYNIMGRYQPPAHLHTHNFKRRRRRSRLKCM